MIHCVEAGCALRREQVASCCRRLRLVAFNKSILPERFKVDVIAGSVFAVCVGVTKQEAFLQGNQPKAYGSRTRSLKRGISLLKVAMRSRRDADFCAGFKTSNLDVVHESMLAVLGRNQVRFLCGKPAGLFAEFCFEVDAHRFWK